MTDFSSDPIEKTYDVVAIGAHPDDLEAVMGGTAVRLVQMNHTVLFVDSVMENLLAMERPVFALSRRCGPPLTLA